MGQEIVYCFKCSSRVVAADTEKGGGWTIGDRVACSDCATALLTTLAPKDREDLLARMLKTTAKQKSGTKRTPRRGTEIPSSTSLRTAPPRTPVVGIVAGALGVLALLLVYMMFGGSSRPADAPSSPPEAKAPAPRPLPPPPPRPDSSPAKESFDTELARIDESVAGVVRQEGFKEALDYLASARKRHEAPEWGAAIDQRLAKTNAAAKSLYETVESKARRGSDFEVKEIVERVGRWGLPEYAAALKKALESAAQAAFKQGADGVVCVEAEHPLVSTEGLGHAWTRVQSLAGFEGEGAMQASPNSGTLVASDYAGTSPRMDFRIDFVKTGKHYLWMRAAANADSDNSFHAGFDGEPLKTLVGVAYSASKKWTWTNKQIDGKVAQFDVAAPGIHSVQIWMREDGAILDRFVITSDSKWSPKGNGPPESPR